MISSWPGLSRPSTSSSLFMFQDVDARHKSLPGLDPGPGMTGESHGPWCSRIYELPFAPGKVNANTAPRGSFASAQSRPPWASMIDRQIDSPVPVPLDLVV
jgi:hypothetical protein